MLAIIRTKNGEDFLAELNEAFDAVRVSAALPTLEATDRETGEVDWPMFREAELHDFDEPDEYGDPRERWTSEHFAIVHRFEEPGFYAVPGDRSDTTYYVHDSGEVWVVATEDLRDVPFRPHGGLPEGARPLDVDAEQAREMVEGVEREMA